MNRQVLILSAPIGAGHMLAARAIRERIAAEYDHVDVVEATAFDFLPWNIGQVFLRVYLSILRLCPWLYQAAYRWGNQQNGSLIVRDCLNTWLAKRAEKWLRGQHPSCIICTHATPAGIACAWKRKYKQSVPLYGIVTDYVVHSWWIYNEVNAYFVAHEQVKAALAARLQPHQKVYVSGIPIRGGFAHPVDRNTFREQQNLPQGTFVCLLMGGGNGLLPMAELIECCCKITQVHVVAITGGNKDLYEQLLPYSAKNITVLGLVNNIWDWMNAADLLVSKAGGVTAAEALAMGLPLAFYRPLPGQEMGNVRFLEKIGAAVQIVDCQALKAHVLGLQQRSAQAGLTTHSKNVETAAHVIALTVLGENSTSLCKKA